MLSWLRLLCLAAALAEVCAEVQHLQVEIRDEVPVLVLVMPGLKKLAYDPHQAELASAIQKLFQPLLSTDA